MANPNIILIKALRDTANRLREGATYAWGNHGACNCGNLLQVITPLSRQEIMSYAQTGIGEWTELASDYCGVTDAPVDLLLSKLIEVGLTPSDIHDLEYLDNREVLENLPGGFRWLKRNERNDVIDYFETFADMLEARLMASELMQVAEVRTKVEVAF
jgi:hypothetical protein